MKNTTAIKQISKGVTQLANQSGYRKTRPTPAKPFICRMRPGEIPENQVNEPPFKFIELTDEQWEKFNTFHCCRCKLGGGGGLLYDEAHMYHHEAEFAVKILKRNLSSRLSG